MLKLGFFLDSNTANNQVEDILESTHHNCAGLWVQDSNAILTGNLPQRFNCDEDLIACSDVAVIATNNDLKFELTSKTIKKGVTPILNNTQGLSNSSLNQLQQLALEIGVNIEFCQLGFNFNDIELPISTPFITHLKRSIESDIMNESTFREILLYDLATALKISKLDIRKVRAYSLPQYATIPSNLFVMIDFCNSSVVSYTLQTNSSTSSLDIQISTSEKKHSYTISDRILFQNSDIKSCIANISNNTKFSNNIDLALAATHLVDTVISKINQ
ncbi:MAG: hypothetical protein AB7S48_05880 [Bacteroidales bacterium]